MSGRHAASGFRRERTASGFVLEARRVTLEAAASGFRRRVGLERGVGQPGAARVGCRSHIGRPGASASGGQGPARVGARH